MINISNVEVHGIVRAIYSARNAMNSWNKSDSDLENEILGKKDLDLAKKLCKAGTDHRKFMRMIVVYADITAPLYWWKEFDTYKVGTVANSCSTMHKIHEKEFTLDDFSHEHLLDSSLYALESIISGLNNMRYDFINFEKLNTPSCIDKKDYWWQMIQMLPSSYNQKRTVMLNYEVLSNIYKSRRNHKLDEWIEFCKIIETLPHSEFITGKGVENE